MDIEFWVVLWIIFIVAQNIFDKKKIKQPTNIPPNNSKESPNFEIPTLANDPNFPGEEEQILFENPTPSAEVREIDLSGYYRQKKNEVEKIQHEEIKFSEREQKKLPLGLNPESAMNAIILGEVLGKPKSLRKK